MTDKKAGADQGHLKHFFSTNPRYARSVDLARDFSDSGSAEGYVVTPLAASVVDRVSAGLQPGARARSWSITGPYGSGKSACCLFLARVLSTPSDQNTQDARTALRKADPKSHSRLCRKGHPLYQQGLIPLIVAGSREPLVVSILKALDRTIEAVFRCDSGIYASRRRIADLLEQVAQGETIASREVVELVQEFAKAACARNAVSGVILIIDELGKSLEYASFHPDTGDIFILQELAEAANGSGNCPMLLVTVLHQAFEQYASRLGAVDRNEWAKVQGRFENILFSEDRRYMLALIAAAIEKKTLPHDLTAALKEEAARTADLSAALHGVGRQEWTQLVQGCAPLHPAVALLLPAVFKSGIAQNERSLFAFLTSGEPFGLQEHLKSAVWQSGEPFPFYFLDELYDYISGAFGNVILTGSHGKRWAEITHAIERLPKKARPVDERVIKAVGLLSMFGDKQHVKPSQPLLAASLGLAADGPEQEFRQSLKRLTEANILLFRKHMDAFGLWEGSDVDLDERLKFGLNRLPESGGLASHIQAHYQPHPHVVKKHLYETGTLRYFDVVIVDEDALADAVGSPLDGVDGRIVFVIPSSTQTAGATKTRVLGQSSAMSAPEGAQTVFAVVSADDQLRQALEEVRAWEWVQTNTPELEGDRVARTELNARLGNARTRFENLCDQVFGKSTGWNSARWIHEGEEHEFAGPRQFTEFLTNVCDRVFAKAPVVQNELVNRKSLSSAAAAARTRLIACMLSKAQEEGLGIEGNPPEMSMYVSVLRSTGLHCPEDDGPAFVPSSDDPGQLAGLWARMDGFLTQTEKQRRSVADLFEMLRQPPCGLRDGLLPIFLAARVIADSSEIALYEDGAFVPEPDIVMFERLMKAPQRFEIQRFRIKGVRREVFAHLINTFSGNARKEKASFLDAVRPLFVFMEQLPPFCMKTDTVSETAQAIRTVLRDAEEPHTTLFRELPEAVGLRPFDAADEAEATEVGAFFERLKQGLIELQRSYDLLLLRVQKCIIESMATPTDIGKARQQLSARGQPLLELLSDMELKAFVDRLVNQNQEDRQWLESVGALVATKPTREWSDQDLSAFEVNLMPLANRFQEVEEIASERGKLGKPAAGATASYRLRLVDQSGHEASEIVHVDQRQQEEIQGKAEELSRQLYAAASDRQMQISILAEITRHLLNGKATQDKEKDE